MSWSAEKTVKRVRADMERLPKVDVSDIHTLRKDLVESREFTATANGSTLVASTVSIPRDRAVQSDTVQAYIEINGMDRVRQLFPDGEVADAHALGLLHDVYASVDRLIDRTDFQRVDYHESRTHLVVMADNNDDITSDDLRKAIAAVEAIRLAVQQISTKRFGNRVELTTAAGIDIGRCLAINNGSGSEQEPLFIGSAANQAAKLARNQASGIHLSKRAQRLLFPGFHFASRIEPHSYLLNDNAARQIATARYAPTTDVSTGGVDPLSRLVEQSVNAGRRFVQSFSEQADSAADPEFRFFFQAPPMKRIRYRDLMPSRTLRHPAINLFADICGYTKFVDHCIATGDPGKAVRALYIIRNELKAVLQEDFGGRKLRFIGDCIHGFAAIGRNGRIHAQESVAVGVRIASAMLESLKICKSLLAGIDELELSIGMELGVTPISRLGLRGDRSVRASSSFAADEAESLQHACAPGQIKLGRQALEQAPAGIFDFVSENTGLGVLPGYAVADSLLGRDIFQPPKPAIVTTPMASAVASPRTTPPRAYLCYSE